MNLIFSFCSYNVRNELINNVFLLKSEQNVLFSEEYRPDKCQTADLSLFKCWSRNHGLDTASYFNTWSYVHVLLSSVTISQSLTGLVWASDFYQSESRNSDIYCTPCPWIMTVLGSKLLLSYYVVLLQLQINSVLPQAGSWSSEPLLMYCTHWKCVSLCLSAPPSWLKMLKRFILSWS